ncbi:MULTISPECIES: TolC family protein [unclassified Synechococcus]|uniref:TolC family protein n=1 Tax=unclassified Synechococcus TaxID=2626047 RepID=UPI001E6440F7|nr:MULTISPECIES: TolC family protein [unclassified Synechococcus]
MELPSCTTACREWPDRSLSLQLAEVVVRRQDQGPQGQQAHPLIRSFIRGSFLIPIVGLLMPAASKATPDAGAPARLNYGGNTYQLERSWSQLNQQLDSLDTLLGPAPDLDDSDNLKAPELPSNLMDANRPAEDALSQDDSLPDPTLSLPGLADQSSTVKSVSLQQAIAIAFRNNPELQIQREQIAAQGATVASLSGAYWPTISVFADLEGFQSGSTTFSPYGNNNFGFGPLFAKKGQSTNFAVLENDDKKISGTDGPFYIPAGGGLYADSNGVDSQAGLQLNYALIDFARTPRVRSADAKLQQFKQQYANQLRALQLEISEAYYQLQLNEQLVRIRDAVVRTDLIVLEDTLNLKQAGLVPRVDLLRRNATLATDQEELIQALADRAVARRALWTLLNLPADVIPSAGDAIGLAPAWPLSLEQSLLAAYDSNPELDAILATRRALALQQDETAAQLLPKLSLFASVGGMASVERTFNFSVMDACCGGTFFPLEQVAGYDWSVGLAFNWMIFNAGATANAVKALSLQEQAASQSYAATRNTIRLRLERAFLNHEASLAKLVSARRAVGASKEAFRDSTLRYKTGLTNEVDLSVTQTQLVDSLVNRLIATVDVNVTYAQLLRELLPMPTDPDTTVPTELTLEGFSMHELNQP